MDVSSIFLWTRSSGVIVTKSIFGQISLKCFATGPDFFVFMFDLCSVNRSCNFLLVSPTYMALQFEHFIAYTTPSDWQLRFSLRGTSVFWVDKILFVSVIWGQVLHLALLHLEDLPFG